MVSHEITQIGLVNIVRHTKISSEKYKKVDAMPLRIQQERVRIVEFPW